MKIYSTFFNGDSGNVVFSRNETGINIDLNMLILTIILMKMILILLILSDFWIGILNLKNAKHLKIRNKLTPMVWYP